MSKVSIIMGVYNSESEEMLLRSINSIINQTYREWEFIVVDDGSTDETYKILERIAKKDKRIILLHNELNLGLAKTLNIALEKSNGIFVARMDADDYSTPQRLEKQVQFLERNLEFDFVGTCVKLVDENGEWGERKLKEYPISKDFLWTSEFVHPTVMFRKSSLSSIGNYRVSTETRRAEDYDLFMRMYAEKMKGYNLQMFLFLYTEDKQSYKKRRYKYRLDEVIVRYKGFKKLGLMPYGFIFVIKPLIVGLIPSKIMRLLKE